MKKESKKEGLSGSHLEVFEKDFEKIQKAENYLKIEMEKLEKEEEKVSNKIEKGILKLRKRINFLQRGKKRS